MLYPKQQEIVDNLYKAYQSQALFNDRHLYISGEMGVGKTYMASALANKMKPKHALVICPDAVCQKWKQVYQEFNPNQDIVVYHSKLTITKKQDLPDCLIMPEKSLYRFLTQLDFVNPYDLALLKTKLANSMSSYERNSSQSFKYTDILSVAASESESIHDQIFDLVIADEIHTYRITHQNFVGLYYLLDFNKQTPFLGLTGTLFNQNLDYLLSLLLLLNPSIFKKQAYKIFTKQQAFTTIDMDKWFSISAFYLDLWQYLGAQISLSDIKQKANNNINQEIMPIKALPLSDAQKAWQNLVRVNLHSLATHKKIERIIMNYLDFPENKAPVIRRTSHDETDADHQPERRHYFAQYYDCGLLLKPIALKETAKFKQLMKILKENPVHTLIFVEDKKILKELSRYIPNTEYVPEKIAKKDVANYINQTFKQTYCQNMLVTSKQLSVGVDITQARNIIWYQVPLDVATILQAQRRVLRLSHLVKSKVWYLFYENTSQADIIKQVSSSSVSNSATYNVRSTDNLAKLTHVLFGGIHD